MAATTTESRPSQSSRSTSLPGPGGPWHRRAPRRLARAYETADERGWSAWQKHLRARKLRPPLKLLDKNSPLLWALSENVTAGDMKKLIATLARATRPGGRPTSAVEKLAESWLAAAEQGVGSTNGAAHAGSVDLPLTADDTRGLECLAWCAALPALAARLSEAAWWKLLNRLVAVAGVDLGEASALESQLLGVELPLALAGLFPELEACDALAEKGRRTRDADWAEMLEPEGTLHNRLLPELRPLLACWTRCQAWDKALGAARGEARRARPTPQFAGFVERALRWSRTGGQQVLSGSRSPRWNPHLVRAARQAAGEAPAVKRALRLAAQGAAGRAGAKWQADAPRPGFHNEWAGTALLRCDWRPSAPRLAVTYGRTVEMELNVGSHCLWSGAWNLELRHNGRLLEQDHDWDQVAWESDENAEYLELSLQLSDEITVERHILLPRRAGFVLLADAVLGIQQGTLEYRGTLPLGAWSQFAPAADAREGMLQIGGRARARALPLALSEWRGTPAPGELVAGATGLELRQQADAQSLLAPLFIDFAAPRLRQEITWRQLTVAQTREIVARDVAVGYRVAAGRSQWLVYRSLASPDVRTVLGANLAHEFLVGTFEPDGHIETLLEIQAAP